MGAAHIVTGAFSYTGRYLTRRLLGRGIDVRTLTNRPPSACPFGVPIPSHPFTYDDPAKLVAFLKGADVLYNTYWVRFDYGANGYDLAIRNTRILFDAARRRIVHVSIANPSMQSPLPYYSGKAALEEDLARLGVSYAVVRPTVIFGDEDILVNNIAWFLRRLPVFAIPGDGTYGLQPIFVEDMAALLDQAGAENGNRVVDAVGPESYTFEELARLIRETVASRAWIVHAPPWLSHVGLTLIGWTVGDVILTRDEITGLMAGLLVSRQPPTGATRLSEWIRAHKATIGAVYANEVARHFAARRPS